VALECENGKLETSEHRAVARNRGHANPEGHGERALHPLSPVSRGDGMCSCLCSPLSPCPSPSLSLRSQTAGANAAAHAVVCGAAFDVLNSAGLVRA
jgi:hypothetical protein